MGAIASNACLPLRSATFDTLWLVASTTQYAPSRRRRHNGQRREDPHQVLRVSRLGSWGSFRPSSYAERHLPSSEPGSRSPSLPWLSTRSVLYARDGFTRISASPQLIPLVVEEGPRGTALASLRTFKYRRPFGKVKGSPGLGPTIRNPHRRITWVCNFHI